MKIILSRKGFDSAAGGCPSPILPDGRLRCLPIPDNKSVIKYASIYSNDHYPTGSIVETLTKKKISAFSHAHLDPDIDPMSRNHDKNWRGVFGQCGASQSHLQNQRVDVGDIFLFFGLYRQTGEKNGKLEFNKKANNEHILWGWMQIDNIIHINHTRLNMLSWCSEHPHIYYPQRHNNVIYTASQNIKIQGHLYHQLPGSGIFSKFHPRLKLTAEESKRPSVWRLPDWFSPKYGNSLSYHTDPKRWRPCDYYKNKVLLELVGRGQEFVIDIKDDATAKEWLLDILCD
jgi:hypothetical protein